MASNIAKQFLELPINAIHWRKMKRLLITVITVLLDVFSIKASKKVIQPGYLLIERVSIQMFHLFCNDRVGFGVSINGRRFAVVETQSHEAPHKWLKLIELGQRLLLLCQIPIHQCQKWHQHLGREESIEDFTLGEFSDITFF